MKYFTSDFHFGHDRDFIYNARGFSSVHEHNDKLIEKFNSVVTDKDETYFLGDFCFDKNFGYYLSRLNGRLICIEGNHDKDFAAYARNNRNPKIISYNTGFINIYVADKQPVTLCHFAMHSWNKSHFDAWMLYGHHHSKTDFGGKTLNVSIDNLDGFPISETDLVKYMSKRPHNWDYMAH